MVSVEFAELLIASVPDITRQGSKKNLHTDNVMLVQPCFMMVPSAPNLCQCASLSIYTNLFAYIDMPEKLKAVRGKLIRLTLILL